MQQLGYLYPDAHDSTDPRYFHEVYGLMSIHIEGMVLGFVHWFHGDSTHWNPDFYNERFRYIGKGVGKGTLEMRIAVSRDGGKTWDRTASREAWIPHGTRQHSYDRLVRLDWLVLTPGRRRRLDDGRGHDRRHLNRR